MTVGASLSALPTCRVVPSPLSAQAVAAGYLPDMRSWEPADIVLLGSTRPTRLSQVIVDAQQRYGTAAQWTHAALYVGNGQVVEAVIRPDLRVIRRGIDAYVPTRTFAVLRYPGLTPAERLAVVTTAFNTLNTRYSLGRAFQAGFDEWLRRLAPAAHAYVRHARRRRRADFRLALSRCICSDVIEHAFVAGAGKTTVSENIDFIMPASLRASSILRPMNVSWCRIGG